MPILPLSGASTPKGAMVPIANVRTTAGASNIVFSNIPQIYRDLYLSFSVEATTEQTAFQYIYLNNFGDNITSTAFLGAGTSNIGGQQTGTNSVFSFGAGYSSATYPCNVQMHILNYANTSTWKTALVRSSDDRGGIYGGGGVLERAVLLQSTAALTQIVIATFNAPGVFKANSSFSLYGVRSAGQ